MKKADLTKVADEFNELMEFKGDDKIDTALAPKDLTQQVKEAALWMYATDEISEETVKVLKQMEWSKDDFENLKDGQDPLPVFYRYGIMEEEKPKGVPLSTMVV